MLFVNIKIGEILWAAPPVIKRTGSSSPDTLCVTFIGSVCRLVCKTNVKRIHRLSDLFVKASSSPGRVPPRGLSLRRFKKGSCVLCLLSSMKDYFHMWATDTSEVRRWREGRENRGALQALGTGLQWLPVKEIMQKGKLFITTANSSGDTCQNVSHYRC